MATAKSSMAQIKMNGAMMPAVDALALLGALPDSTRLTTSEAAIFLQISVTKLERMLRDQIGPPYVADGARNSISYMKGDLKAWLVSIQTGIPIAKGVKPTAQSTAAAMALAAPQQYFLPEVPDAITIKGASAVKALGKK